MTVVFKLKYMQVLDLSYNEIVLKEADTSLLTYTPQLRKLFLRRSFNPNVNQTEQWRLLMAMFDEANLKHLQVYRFWLQPLLVFIIK